MSFQNYDQFQGQPQGEQPNQTGSQPDLGQQMDASGNGFPQQGSAGGPPGSSGGDGQQGAGKTTLWSVPTLNMHTLSPRARIGTAAEEWCLRKDTDANKAQDGRA